MMGMFTRLSHDGRIYQFKTGWDSCETYGLWDRIPWCPDPRYPGDHIDGAYDTVVEGIGNIGPWVIIKDCMIVAVAPRSPGETEQGLRSRYDIQLPPKELWSELDWAEEAYRKAYSEVKYQRYLRDNPGTNACSYFMHCKLQERSFTSQLLPANPARREQLYDLGSPEPISTRPLTIEPAGCPGQVVQVCSVEVLGRVYDLHRADDTTCDWILKVGNLVIMAWEVSSTAGGRAWNFNTTYLENIALRMIGDDNPMSLPSNRGDVLVLIRPVSESTRDDDVPEMTDDH